jgi:hypothetical protein
MFDALSVGNGFMPFPSFLVGGSLRFSALLVFIGWPGIVFMLLLVQSTHGLFSLVSKGWLARISLSCLSHGFGGFQQLFFVDDCGFWWKWILGDATFGPIKHFTIWQAIRDHVKGRSAGSFCRSLKCKLWADSSIGFACFGVAVILGKMCFRSGVSDFAFV